MKKTLTLGFVVFLATIAFSQEKKEDSDTTRINFRKKEVILIGEHLQVIAYCLYLM
mgnify:CR=1 FL=1